MHSKKFSITSPYNTHTKLALFLDKLHLNKGLGIIKDSLGKLTDSINTWHFMEGKEQTDYIKETTDNILGKTHKDNLEGLNSNAISKELGQDPTGEGGLHSHFS